MDEGLPEIIRQRKLEDHPGLSLAQVISQIPKHDVKIAIDVLTAYVRERCVQAGSEEHDMLLHDGIDILQLTDHERQQYFRAIFYTVSQNGYQTECE